MSELGIIEFVDRIATKSGWGIGPDGRPSQDLLHVRKLLANSLRNPIVERLRVPGGSLLADLQQQSMEIAEIKGWGTNPDNTDTPEKLRLIWTEIIEARQEYAKIMETWTMNVPRNRLYTFGVYCEGLKILYRTEAADILLRTLHLGGIHQIQFPDPTLEQLPIVQEFSQFPARQADLEGILKATSTAFSMNRMEDFSTGLIQLAYYCIAIAYEDGFDIFEIAHMKNVENMSRTWEK